MNIPLDEVIYFDMITSHPTTGAATDADSTPTFEVYEETTDTDIGVGGNMTKRTSLTGNYRGTATLSAANGFEAGKWYSIIGSATVNSVAGKGVLKNFRVTAAETTAGKPKVDVDALLTQAKADVNAEVLDVLNVDTFAEIGQETPAATQTLRKMIAYLYKTFRNKKTQTASQFALYADDATTVDQKATVSDDGTTTTVGELATGP